MRINPFVLSIFSQLAVNLLSFSALPLKEKPLRTDAENSAYGVFDKKIEYEHLKYNEKKGAPVHFIENRGQLTDMSNRPVSNVFFKAQTAETDFYITDKGLSFVFKKQGEQPPRKLDNFDKESVSKSITTEWEQMSMNLKGASIKKENIVKEDPSAEHYNFFYPHCPNGIMEVKGYEKITIRNVYPGIDWVFYNSSLSGFKYDFIVHAGADPDIIRLEYYSLKAPELLGNGDLLLENKLGTLTEKSPYSYYAESGDKLKSRFKIHSKEKTSGHFYTEIGFELSVSERDSKLQSNQTLVIDPQLIWATLYGGGGSDWTNSTTTDTLGNLFATGDTHALGFPILNNSTYYQSGTSQSYYHVFILKFNNAGVLIWGTYYGGSTWEDAFSITTDKFANIFVTGEVNSPDFPVQNAGTYYQGALAGVPGANALDAFILKFDNSGNRLWATFYGGTNGESGYSVASDNSGNVYMVGATNSTNFPLQTAGLFNQSSFTSTTGVSFIVKFDNLGTRLWSTYYGTAWLRIYAISVDASDNLILAGFGLAVAISPLVNPGLGAYYQSNNAGLEDAYISKFNSSGALLWATNYGGSKNERAYSVATDANGNIFVSGITSSTNLPVQNAGTFYMGQGIAGGYDDAFILKFNSGGVRQWATYYGGTNWETMILKDNLCTDACGNLYMSLSTESSDIPTQYACNGGFYDNSLSTFKDPFLIEFSNTGSLLWATYLGGDGNDVEGPVEIDVFGNLFVNGGWAPTLTSTYPFTNPGGGSYYDNTPNGGNEDCFITKFVNTQTLTIQNFSYISPVCPNSTLSLSPVKSVGFINGGTYSTSPGLNLDPNSGVINTFASSPGTYTITYYNTLCACVPVSPITATFVLNTPPTITVNTPTICSGSTTTLTALVTPTTGNTYTWSIPGINTFSVAINPTVNTVYTVSTTGANGCINSSTANVSVMNQPVLQLTGDTLVCSGTVANVIASGATSYTWDTGSSASTLSLTISASTIHVLSGTGSNGCVSTINWQIHAINCTNLKHYENLNTRFTVLPNPNKGDFFLSSNSTSKASIVNSLGQVIIRIELSEENDYQFKVSGLAAGIYFIAEDSTVKSSCTKIVVER